MEISGNILTDVTNILTHEGYLIDPVPFSEAFRKFIGNENFEERADPEGRWIDKPVLEYLVMKFGR